MKPLYRTTLALLAAAGGLALSSSAFAAFPDPYCVRGYSASVEPITLVDVDGINNTTSPTVGGTPADEDFTAIIGALRPGGAYPITVKGNTDGNYQSAIAVYVDWNNNGTFDADEGSLVGTITNSTGVDAIQASNLLIVPASATIGQTRMRVTKQYTTAVTPTIANAPACGTTGYGQAEDYTVDISTSATIPATAYPHLSKSFSPAFGDVSQVSTLTLALGQYNADVASLTLVADLVDTLPAGMTVATTPNASTTCPGGSLTAAAGAGSVTLATGAQIPPAGCTVTVDVQVAAPGNYANTIPADSLQTDTGNYATAASAIYQATSPGFVTYNTGFEPPAYTVANLSTQQGWYASVANDWKVVTTNPGAGVQAVRGTWTAAGSGTSFMLSPTQVAGTTAYAIASAKLSITPTGGGVDWDFAPQDIGAGKVITRVRFAKDAGNPIQVLADLGGGTLGYAPTGATWTGGSYFDLKFIVKRADMSYTVCINGSPVYSAPANAGFASNINNVAIIGTKGAGTQNNILDVDDFTIDNSNIGTCNGLPPTHTVTSSVGTPSGTITPLGAQTVNEGDTIAFTLAADPGYAIDNVASTCGGTLDGGTGVFTTAAITADCTVTANFAPITWTVTSSVGTPSGTITPSGAQTVNEGGTLTFTLTADPGYEIDTVGGSCGGTLTGNSFETDPVTADCDVIANFKAAGGNPDIVCTAFNHPVMQTSNGTYINWETGAWSDTGSLSGAHFNPYGSSNLTFFWPTPTTNAGVTSGGTFAVLSLGDTIGASSTFARSGAPTAWRAGADGYLGFSFACSTASVCYGYMHFTTTGPSGYPATMGDYCWNKAGDPITIAVPGPFLTVTPSVGVGSGAISPSTPQSVNVGGTKTFTLAPAAGFHTLSVTGTCGGTLTGNSFTTDPVTADCTVVANFEANPSAAITPASLALSAVQGASDNGAINIANVGGGTLTYSITESPARLPTIPTAMDSPVVQSRDAQPSRAYAPRPNPQPQAVVIDEGFEDVAGLLGAGWITANHSSPMGAATWAQCGGTAIPPAFDGDPNSCALVNYTSTTGTGTISNWLLTPEISFNGGSTASFYTRTSSGAPYADRLEVRVCSSGDCTDFGTGATDVGNFTTLLLTINPGLQSGPDATGVNGYPDTWTQFTLSGLPTSGTGRIAFRYFVTDGGPSGSNSNIIGIDRLVVDNGAPGGCAMPTDIPWMSVAPGSGAIAAGTNEDVTVTADATGLAVGTYTADVCVATNDPVTPVTAVPVSFTVTSSAIAPTLGKTFAPDTVLVNESSVATLTLSNANATDAVLTAPLVDTLPAGLNVTAATTTCLLGVGGSMPAPMASVTLPAGAKIPANGSCTVSITVSTPTPGSYVNTIAAGALQTDLGSNAAEATATLTVNPLPPPLATFTPGSFSFTVQADQTTSGTLNIANAAGRDVLSYSIDAREVLRPVARASGLSKRASAPRVNLQPARLVSSGRSGGSASAQPLYNPLASYTFQLDDGTYENSVGFVDSGPPAVEWGAVWINRFNVTEALTIDSISIMWPTNPEGTLVGMQPNLVVYYDADADGDPTNAQRIGTDQLVTIAALDVFETYTTNFAVPGAGDVYVGFVDQWSLNGYSPGLYPAALDETASQGMSWLAVAGTPPTDVDNLGNNDMIGTIDDFAMPGNWLIRATGTSGAPTTCTGAVVGWMSASPASGTVNSGADTDVTITVDPSAGGLVPGSYSAELCITSNDPTQPLVAIPVSVTVTEPPVPFCNGGADEVFCDGFESAAGGDIVSGTINQPLVQDGDGNTFDFVTGQFGVYDAGRVDDINIYDFGSGMYVYWYGDMAALAVGGVVDSGGTEFAVLHSGDTIGPGSTISAASLAMTNWLGGTDGYIGIAFENEDTGQLNYGYIRMTTTASSGYPAQWLEYAYDRTGAAITIP